MTSGELSLTAFRSIALNTSAVESPSLSRIIKHIFYIKKKHRMNSVHGFEYVDFSGGGFRKRFHGRHYLSSPRAECRPFDNIVLI